MDNQAFSKIWIVVILVVLIAGGLFAWQHWWMPKEEIAEIGPDAVWSIWSNTEAISELQKCPADLETFKHASACVVSIMEKYGASEKAIEFFEMTHYWFMTDFQEMGKVDLVQISTPWRANSNDQWALVNGSPEIVYVEDEASNSINYDYFVNTFPRYSLSSTGGFMKQDGQSFLFQFPIIDERGCRVCYSGYMAVVSFNFQDGNYVAPEILNFCTEEIFKAGIKDERFLTCDQVRETDNYFGIIGTSRPQGESQIKEEGLKILSSHNTYTDYLGYFHVAGEVQNVESKNVKGGTVKVTFIDNEGNAVLTGSGWTMIDIVNPGEKSPFDIVFSKKPSFATYMLQVTEWEPTEEISYTDIKVENQFLQKYSEESDWYELKGNVKNIGNKDMANAYIVVTFYDNFGKVIDAPFIFSENDSLKIGESSPFSVGVRPETYNKMKNYVIYTEGYLEK